MSDELWMVLAIIQPFKLDGVLRALEDVAGFAGITVSDCRGFGQEKLETSNSDPGRNRQQPDAGLVDFTAKLKLEIAVAGRDRADAVARAILQSAHTGRRGDGKLFIWPLADAMRVRTGEVGAPAL